MSVVLFFSLTLVLTWVVWIPRALASQGVLVGPAAEVVTSLGGAWSWAPAVAALISAALVGGRREVRVWLGRLGRWRVGLRWYAVALLGPAVLGLVTGGAGALLDLGDLWPRALDLGAAAVAVFAVLLLTDGLGEEAGWRGYALPALLSRHRALAASLVLGVFWALWHLPLLFTVGSVMYGSPVLFQLLDLPATAVLYTWLFLRTRESALLAVILHASFNLWSPDAVPAGTAAQLSLVLALKWALVVVAVATGLTPRHRSGTGPVDELGPPRAGSPT